MHSSIRSSAWSACPGWTRIVALATLALAVTLTSARAADRVETSSSLADTTRPAALLKEVVVTGSRYAREIYRSPQSMSLVPRRLLRQELALVPGDALALVPGVASSKDSPWAQQIVMRGLSGQRVLVLVDGSPMNNVRGRGPQPSLIGPEQIDRIEVVRGPASVAYGSDALGGVVNIITREATEGVSPSLNGSATIGGSTVDQERNGYIELMPRIGKFSAFLSSGARKALNFYAPKDMEIKDSGFSSYNALFNLRYDFTEKTALKGGVQLYRGNDIGIPGLSVDVPGYSQSFQYKNYDRNFVHLTLDHGYSDSWLAGTQVRGYWQEEKRDFYSDIVTGLGPGVEWLQNKDRNFDLKTWGAQMQATSVKTDLYQFTSGLDFVRDLPGGTNDERNAYTSNGMPIPPLPGLPGAQKTTMSVPNGTFDSYAGYVQSEWFLHPQWTLSGGGRYTHYRYRSDQGIADPDPSNGFGAPPVTFDAIKVDNDALSGSVGLVYEPVTNLYLTGNVANGYRQPNAQDLFFDGPASVGTVLGNTGLKPEKSVSYDLGLRWGPGDIAFTGSAFYSTYKDLIDAVLIGQSPDGRGIFKYFNIATARIWGGEAEAQWQFLPQWRARAAISGAVGDITSRDAIMKLYGVDLSTAALPSVPPFGGNAGLRWTDASRRFWVEPSMRFSWRYNRLPIAPPGLEAYVYAKKEWLVGDLFAGAAFPTGQRIEFGVRNIGNATYQPALASLLEPGISFVGSLSTSF